MLAYTVAMTLTAIEAWFAIGGLVALYPGAPTAIVVMGVVLELGKLGAGSIGALLVPHPGARGGRP